MRLEVFKIKDDNWGVKFPGDKGLEIAGFETVESAHAWLLQFAIQSLATFISQEKDTETKRQILGAALLGANSEKKKQ